MLSVVALLVALISPSVGRQTDRGRGRIWCVGAAVLYAAGIFSMLYAEQIPLGLVGVGLFCFFLSLVIIAVASAALIEGYVTDEVRKRTSTFWAMAGNVGMLSSNAMAYYFLKEHRTQLLLVDLVTTWMYLVFVIVALKNRLPRKPSAGVSVNYFAAIGKVIKQYPVRVALSALLFVSIYAQVYILPVVLREGGLDYVRLVPMIGMLNNVIVIVAGFLVAHGLIFKSARIQSYATFSLIGAGFALFPFAHSETLLVVSTLLWSLGEILIFPVSSSMIYSLYPVDQAGMGAAMKIILLRLAQVFAPIGGLLVAHLSPQGQSAILGLPFLLGLIAMILRNSKFR